jgi:hypothetical protein
MPTYGKPNQRSQSGLGGRHTYKLTPALRNDDFFGIKFTHLATGLDLEFEGWVEDFSDNFSSTWNPQTVYGRMDPLATFQGTARTISLSFAVAMDGRDGAVSAMAKVNRLIQFLYPVYEKGDTRDQTVLKAAPLIGLRWTNLIASSDPAGTKLVGYLDGVSYNPEMSQGGFLLGKSEPEDTQLSHADTGDSQSGAGVSLRGPTNPSQIGGGETGQRLINRNTTTTKAYIPKKLSISLNYTVLHTHLGGWIEGTSGYVFGNEAMNGKFPNAQYLTYTKSDTIRQTWHTEASEAFQQGQVGAGPATWVESVDREQRLEGSPEVQANESEVLGGDRSGSGH